jgi:TPR repeat protein
MNERHKTPETAGQGSDRAVTVKARTIIIFAVAIAGLYALVLPLWFARLASAPSSQASWPQAEVNTLAAPLTDAPYGEAPPTITLQEALERLQEAAQAGQTSAMLELAEFYGRGLGVKQNLTERFRWFQKAAAAGDPRGMFLAALCQETGMGTAADQKQARAGFKKAAEAGLPEAHLKVAEDLLAGSEADQARAATHLEQALAGGLPVAANILGRIYLEGAGNLPADPEKARQALLRGAELLDPEALKNLAVMFRQGWGGPADPALALKWYLAAREAGWRDDGLDETLVKLEGELEPQAVREAKAGARAWLAEHLAAKEVPPSEPN